MLIGNDMAVLVVALCVSAPVFSKNLCLVGDFDQQVNDLLKFIRLPPEGFKSLQKVTADIERVLQTQWPGVKVMPYGSTVTGLALKTSDVDCYVDIPGDVKGDPKTLVATALNILQSYPELFGDFETLPLAQVPLLTCVYIPTRIFVDLTFSSPFAVNSSIMLSNLLHVDQRAFDLTSILKYWGTVHDIANGKMTLPSYAIVLMTLFYLQQKKIVPPINALQENVTPHELEHWNIAFAPPEHRDENNETLYELLGGFFKYYKDFDFENTIISTYVGHPIKREHFENLDELKGFSNYKRNLAEGHIEPFYFGHLNVQDIFKHNENTARPKSERWLADRLIKHLREGARMYDVLSKEEFLSALFVPEKRIEAGILKTFWSDGVASLEDCRNNLRRRIR